MNDCLFCKIINKQVPNYTVYEDDYVLAFLDIFPHAKGHTVVIPKTHAVTLQEFDETMTQRFLGGVKKAMERIDVVLKPEGYNVGWNHGDAGGQAVKHFHAHILPRWSDDSGGSMHSIVKKSSTTPVEELAKLFV